MIGTIVNKVATLTSGIVHLGFPQLFPNLEFLIVYAKKYNENKVVINAIGSHHGDIPSTSVISTIVNIASLLFNCKLQVTSLQN